MFNFKKLISKKKLISNYNNNNYNHNNYNNNNCNYNNYNNNNCNYNKNNNGNCFQNKLVKVFCLVLLSVSFFSGCQKNNDTFLNSKYFKENSSSAVPIIISDKNSATSEVARQVTSAIVAISATTKLGTSIGSGVCVKSGGYILTNEHVINGANEIKLYFYDNTSASAKVLWKDEIMDIAILKSEKAIPFLQMSDNSLTLTGQDVIAVGTPLSLNFTHTFTKGIVSALNRTIKINTDFGEALMQNLIQHDASINPGNSGGPLINQQGEVIGINTLKISTAEGLGFAIPIDSVVSVVNGVYSNYNYQTPFLGVYGFDASLNSLYNDTQKVSGLYVESVLDNSPAQQVGILAGDVILKINDVDIENALAFRKELFKKTPNTTITITVNRNGEKIELKVLLKDALVE